MKASNDGRHTRRMAGAGLPAGALVSACLFAAAPAPGASYEPTVATVERRVEVMGTTMELAVRSRRREDALAASEAALAELARVEALLTTWKPGGELAGINAAPPSRAVAVSREVSELLAAVFAWVPRTQDAFDPTALPLVRAWDLRGAGRIPTAGELAAARKATGSSRFRIDASAGRVTRLDPDAGIDEGAWGKGYGLDRAARALGQAGSRSALLDLGGQVFAVGLDAGDGPWRVPVADPRERERTVLELGLSNLSAATSGNSERARTVAGRRIGHILDPRTGEPAPNFGSVTVVAPSALVADILSTALFVLGPDRGLALSRALREQGVEHEALFLVVHGERLDAIFSPGFPQLVLSADPKVVGDFPIGQP